MEQMFIHLPSDVFSNTDISASSKLVLARLWTLSKDGKKTVFAQRRFLSNELGLSVRTVSNCFKELEALGYLKQSKSSNSFDRTRNFSVSCKSCKIEVAQSSGKNLQGGIAKVARGKLQNLQGGIAKVATSSLDRSKLDQKIDQRESKTHSENIDFSFDSVLSAMQKISKEITEHSFSADELKEQAQNYLDKSQEYRFYKGNVTANKLKAWLRAGIRNQKQSENKRIQKNSSEPVLEDNPETIMNRVKKYMELQDQRKEKKSDPIDADFEIIEEQTENKNAPA